MFDCKTCTKTFHTEDGAKQHMRALGHWGTYCEQCDRQFQSENNLKMHLNSKIHRGTGVYCPFCHAGYTTASGLAHHIERSSCPNARHLSRGTLFRLIRSRDPSGIMTNVHLTWRSSPSTTTSSSLSSSDDDDHEIKGYFTATRHAYTGSRWKCFICDKEFAKKTDLNKHLNSPRHRDSLNIYLCPNNIDEDNIVGCEREFVSLAGCLGHLESGSCAYMRFERVQEQVEHLFKEPKVWRFE